MKRMTALSLTCLAAETVVPARTFQPPTSRLCVHVWVAVLQAVREGRTQWVQLSDREKGEVLQAVDAVRLDSLGAQVCVCVCVCVCTCARVCACMCVGGVCRCMRAHASERAAMGTEARGCSFKCVLKALSSHSSE